MYNAHGDVYNAHMGMTTVNAWVCDVCGYLWLKVAGRVPTNCASKGCRSRRWNSSGVAQTVEQRSSSPQVGGSTPPPRSKVPPKAPPVDVVPKYYVPEKYRKGGK